RKLAVQLENPGGIQRLSVRRAAKRVLLLDVAFEFPLESFSPDHIADAQPAPRHFIFICWPDSARSRTNLVRPKRRFRRFFEFAMEWKNQVRAIAQKQTPLNVDAAFAQALQFRHQRRRIHHYSRADNRLLPRPQNPARNQLQHIAIVADDDRVPGIVPAAISRAVVKRPSQEVDHLPLAFVAPLRANYCNRFHTFVSHLSIGRAALCPLHSISESILGGVCSPCRTHNPTLGSTGKQAVHLRSANFAVPETLHAVIVRRSHRLHHRIANRRADKLKPALLQFFAQRIRFSRPRRHSAAGSRILQRTSIDESPQIHVEAAKFLLHSQKSLCILNRRRNFQPVAYDSRIRQQLSHATFVITRDALDIEVIEHLAIPRAFAQHGFPTQPRLRSLENHHLEKRAVVVNWHTPLFIVILNGNFTLRPRTPSARVLTARCGANR